MKNIVVGIFSIILVLVCVYLYLISPSSMEKKADKFYQDSKYEDAAHFYQLAFTEGNISFKKERILFKLGNSYRLSGETDRSFDFYFMVLQENKSSVYKSRIQEFLRGENEGSFQLDVASQNIEVDLSFLNSTTELSLKGTLDKRDEIYKVLLLAISNDNANLSYQLKDIYRAFKKLQLKVKEKKIEAAVKISIKKSIKDKREMLLIGLEDTLKVELKQMRSNYKLIIHQLESGNDIVTLKNDIFPQAIYVSFSQEYASMGSDNFLTFLERLYDSHENAKIFLMIDDSNKEGLSEILDSWDKDGLYTLVFQDQDELVSKIKESLKARFIWQSNG
ncbi:MAG: hypothetical protein COB02_03445 [Candidatus Cloacimonadota bacterium]|nr:MAG: hypothetical protein COB02_03445 [Candidatus Cloacimonadota bacterium]